MYIPQEDTLIMNDDPLMVHLNTILVPTDCTDHTRIAIKYAVRLAEENSTHLKLLHVLEHQDFPDNQVIQIPKDPDSVRKAKWKLENFWNSFGIAGLQCEMEVREGDVVSEVINLAKQEEVDLIVMCSHGYKGLVYSMKGSTTEKVTRYSPCPVLCLKNEGRQFIR